MRSSITVSAERSYEVVVVDDWARELLAFTHGKRILVLAPEALSAIVQSKLPGVEVITPNPKTSGGARWNYLAAWAYGVEKFGTDEEKIRSFVRAIYKNVPVLAKGGRDATTIFLQRNIGDVLVTFESEVISVDNEFGAGKVDAVHPSISIVAENPVAVVERTVAKKGTGEVAKAYLNYLYSDEAQEIAAKHALRPTNPAILKKYSKTFKPLQLFTVNEVFGSFAEAQKVHFNDGGNFDKLYTVK